MSATVRVVTTPDEPGSLRFPDRCVGCGGLPEKTESRLFFRHLVARGDRQKTIELSVPVPHCERCARTTKVFFLASLIPALAGFVVAGGAAFLYVTLHASAAGLDEMGQPRGTPNSMVLGGGAGLAAGVVGGAIVEILGRVVLFPIYGLALLRAPLLATQLLDGSDAVAGVRGKANRELTRLELTFSDAAIADGFRALNRAALEP